MQEWHLTADRLSRAPRSYFVTGASSGIGLAIARRLHARGDYVIATGRRKTADLPVGFPDVRYWPADLADVAARTRLVEALPVKLDRAILCAGKGYYRALAEEVDSEMAEVVEVNVTANIHLAHGLFQPLQASSGRIAFVGSIASKGASTMPVYAASKAAIDGFARSLALEWQGRIVVKALHPGPTATGMSVRSGRPADLLDRIMLNPETIASAILAVLEESGGYRRTVSYRRILADRLLRRSTA